MEAGSDQSARAAARLGEAHMNTIDLESPSISAHRAQAQARAHTHTHTHKKKPFKASNLL